MMRYRGQGNSLRLPWLCRQSLFTWFYPNNALNLVERNDVLSYFFFKFLS